MQNATRRVALTVIVTLAFVAGCATVPTYNISAEQFRTLYEAPRLQWDFVDYNGKFSGHYGLTLYGLKYAS